MEEIDNEKIKKVRPAIKRIQKINEQKAKLHSKVKSLQIVMLLEDKK